MIVGVGKIDLFFPENSSLKEKRQKLRSIIEKTKNRFNVSIMEIEKNNLWQRAHIGFSVIGQKRGEVEKVMDEIGNFLDSFYFGNIISFQKEIILIGDEL